MKRFINGLILTTIATFCVPGLGNAGDRFDTLLRCKHQLDTQAGEASVVLRPYPLGFSRVKIDPLRQNLISTLAANAGDAVVGQTILKLQRPDSNDTGELDKDSESRNIFVFGQESTPDAIAIFRGREITVFPRLLLAYPRTSLARVRPNDLIATFETQPTSQPKQDLFHDVLIRDVADVQRTGVVMIRGPLANRDGTQQTIDAIESRGDVIVREMMDFFEDSQSDAMKRSLASKVPVYVIERTYRGTLVRFVVPWRTHGLFAVDGPLFNGLFRERLDRGGQHSKWELVMDGWGLMTVMPGDTVSMTYLETIPFFQQVSL